MKLFVDGRKQVFKNLKTQIAPKDRVIWLHAASLGEYEQGVPVLKELKKLFPNHKLLITFFSPSGYQVKKNNNFAFHTTYLPLDSRKNARTFIELAHPDLVLFVKYEIWPNYLDQLKKKRIPALLISGSFRPNQIYFKPYGQFLKEALSSFDHIFVQNKASKKLLEKNNIKQVSVSGDTRFDRVSEQLEMNNELNFVKQFKVDSLCIVMGSTWPADEKLFKDYINQAPEHVKFIIAPHQIDEQHIEEFRKNLKPPTLLYSEKEPKTINDFSVLIINTVGLLTKIYAYGDIAYVGGAAGTTGLHNILEPAAFGLPVLIGQNHKKFPEAKQLKNEGGLFAVKNAKECTKLLQQLVENDDFRKKTGNHSKEFIEKNQGSTKIIMHFIKESLQINH